MLILIMIVTVFMSHEFPHVLYNLIQPLKKDLEKKIEYVDLLFKMYHQCETQQQNYINNAGK